MPTSHDRFPTPHPISLQLSNAAGSVEVVAGDSTETTVDITSGFGDPPVRVELSSDGRTLTVEPQSRRRYHHRLNMKVSLPTGSDVHVETASAGVVVRGAVARLDVTTASGSIDVDQVDGRAEVGSASGSAQVGTVTGPLGFRSASGSLRVHRTGESCQARSASGSVSIQLADGDVAAKTVSGRVTVGEAHRGTVDVGSTSGSVEVGVRRGTLVWLDVTSVTGRARSELGAEEAPAGAGGAALTVRAQSVSGSVTITSTGTSAIAL
jgi:DUF4097 and DUF4098 domain-containing protein YvlB